MPSRAKPLFALLSYCLGSLAMQQLPLSAGNVSSQGAFFLTHQFVSFSDKIMPLYRVMPPVNEYPTMLQLPQLFALRSEHGRVLEASCSFCLSLCLLLFLPSMMKVLADLPLPPQLPPSQLPLASLLSSSQESAVPWLHTLQAHPVWLDPTSPTLTSSSRSLSPSDGSYHTLLRPSS